MMCTISLICCCQCCTLMFVLYISLMYHFLLFLSFSLFDSFLSSHEQSYFRLFCQFLRTSRVYNSYIQLVVYQFYRKGCWIVFEYISPVWFGSAFAITNGILCHAYASNFSGLSHFVSLSHAYLSNYPGYFWELHWFSMGLPGIIRVIVPWPRSRQRIRLMKLNMFVINW